jgi:Baseplate J-like protein
MASNEEVQPILDYSARDFESIRSLLVGLARGIIPEWRTVGEANDFGTLLLELYAYMGDVTNYYIDRVSSEAFLGTAQRRQSVLYMAEMLGYKPIGQHAAITTLSFSLSPSYEGSLQVPAGTLVSTGGTESEEVIYFETLYPLTLEGTNLTKDVIASEGRTVSTSLGTSTGAPNMSIRLPDRGVIVGSIELQTKEGSYVVNDADEDTPNYVRWSEIPSVAAARATQSAFSSYVGDDGYTYILFGDSASGRIPPIGATIEATYRYGIGSRGNNIATGSVTTIQSPGLPTGSLTVTNKTTTSDGVTVTSIGGSDIESVASMRNNIPKSIQVKDRAVTLDDFKALALQVPGVAKAVAYGQIYSAISVKIAPVGGIASGALEMAQLRKNVQSYLQDRILIGTKVFVEDAEWLNVFIELDLFVLPGFRRVQVEADVRAALDTMFAYNNLDLGERITIGEVYRRVMRVEGVDYVDILALNSASASATTVENIEVPFDKIARIKPEGLNPETDPSGLVINLNGGISD